VEEFPENNLTVQNGQLFCLGCRETLHVKKSTIQDHIKTPKHQKGSERLAQQKVKDYELSDYLVKNISTENAGALTKTRDMDMQLFNIKWVQALLKTATPLTKSDDFREFIEATGYSLTTSSNLRTLIPIIAAKQLNELVQPLIDGKFPIHVAFDGTTTVAEAFGIVIRWVEDFVIVQKLLKISHLALSMTAKDTMREMVKVLIQENHFDPSLIVGFSHDRASVNTLAIETLDAIFFRAEDWPCVPHTLDHVGDQFVHQHLDGFWHLWTNVFAYGKKLAQKCYKQLTGHKHKKYSVVRWWSKFECLEQIGVDWATIIPNVLVLIVEQSSTRDSSAKALYEMLMANRRSKEQMIRLEIAAVLDGGSIFRNATSFLEGDGPLIFVAFDTLMSLFNFIANPEWSNVDAVIEDIVATHPRPAQERMRLKAHALSVVQPGFDYFQSKFNSVDGVLAEQMKLLKLARLCNPIRFRELRITIDKLEELFQFKLFSTEDPLISMQLLKRELCVYLALAEDIDAQHFNMDQILPFFKAHSHEIPGWSKFACLLSTQQVNSAGVERVFSMLKNAMKETQESSLSDYVQGVVLNRYNNR
jgi:hypothetical protein